MLYLIQVLHRTPTLGNEAALGHIQVELVHCVVDCLDLRNLGGREGGRERGRERGREGGKGGKEGEKEEA